MLFNLFICLSLFLHPLNLSHIPSVTSMTIVTQQRVIASIWPWGASETLEEERQRQLKNSEREIKSLNKKLDEKEKKIEKLSMQAGGRVFERITFFLIFLGLAIVIAILLFFYSRQQSTMLKSVFGDNKDFNSSPGERRIDQSIISEVADGIKNVISSSKKSGNKKELPQENLKSLEGKGSETEE